MSDQHQDLGFALPPPARSSRTRVVLVLGVVVAAAFTFGYIRHRRAESDVPQPAEARTPRVEVVKPTVLTSDQGLDLPGTVRALEETRLYPRVSGYVRRWAVDIGDKVAAGQLLAEIDAPEVQAQLVQARAQLAQAWASVKQATAQRNYSKSNTERYASLSDQQLVSKGQLEQTQAQAQTDEATVAAAKSAVASQQANVRRLVDLANFTKVVAPFAGTITTRTIDRGSLVSEGNQTPMFTIVATDPVRIFIDVPQTVAISIRSGTEATVTAREFAGRTFKGKVTRSAGALDPDAHTMTTEVQVPNPDGTLLPGMYVQAQVALSAPRRVLEIPATALYNDALGLRVAVVDAQRKIHFAPITIERDTGATLHVATGLTGDERILKLAMPSLPEGAEVELAPTPAPPAKPAGSPPGSASPAGSASGSASASSSH